jgi:hypothetical protein
MLLMTLLNSKPKKTRKAIKSFFQIKKKNVGSGFFEGMNLKKKKESGMEDCMDIEDKTLSFGKE